MFFHGPRPFTPAPPGKNNKTRGEREKRGLRASDLKTWEGKNDTREEFTVKPSHIYCPFHLILNTTCTYTVADEMYGFGPNPKNLQNTNYFRLGPQDILTGSKGCCLLSSRSKQQLLDLR